METIIFNRESKTWSKDSKYNSLFLKSITEYCKNLFSYQGYLYLNRIYECLGVVWDPDKENVCYRTMTGGLEFKIEQVDDDIYLIHIN